MKPLHFTMAIACFMTPLTWGMQGCGGATSTQEPDTTQAEQEDAGDAQEDTGGTQEDTGGAQDDPGSANTFTADVWADNWFEAYVGETKVAEDSVSITTERSFNAESFSFEAAYPFTLNFVIKDFKENDTGLEYIGERNQQMGDGGFIMQLKDAEGNTVAVSNADFTCLVLHKAPLNKDCEKSQDPEADCQNAIIEEPSDWKSADMDSLSDPWAKAQEYSEADVDPKDGYDRISWSTDARLIWTSDLETDNTLLCKVVVSKPN